MIVVIKPLVFSRIKADLIRLNIVERSKNGDDNEEIKWTGRHKKRRGWRDNQEGEVDLTSLTRPETEQFLKCIEDAKVYGTRVLAVDIKKYLKASVDGIKDMRVRTVRQAAWMLERFFAELPHHTVFCKDDYGGNSHSGYYVGDCDYEPEKQGDRSERKEREYAYFYLWHIENDRRHRESRCLHSGDCCEMTCLEILGNLGLTPETERLMTKLRQETEAFYVVREQIGKQHLAVGLGLCDLDNALSKEGRRHSRYGSNKIELDRHTNTRVVIDVLNEKEEKDNGREGTGDKPDPYRWHKWNSRFHAPSEDELVKHLEADEHTAEPVDMDIPVHPLVPCFDLRRHNRLRVHVNNLTEYAYNRQIAEDLVLPKRDWDMVNLLCDHADNAFQDIIGGKGQSMNILAAGCPGSGKTLTAEVFSEFKGMPLYTVQCGQLGIDAEEVENNLSVTLNRANRWNAVLLLDEADVYIRKRGTDMNQNAIVGAFLRVLEYAKCILFMTTNLDNCVDDAITSRCIACLRYGFPSPEDQARIWKILARLNKLELSDEEVAKITSEHPKLSGRDVKNLLKLASFVNTKDKTITAEMVDYALQFKATEDFSKGMS